MEHDSNNEKFNHTPTRDIVTKILDIVEVIHDYQYDKSYIPTESDIKYFTMIADIMNRTTEDARLIKDVLQERINNQQLQ